jgi:hypothetical protein
VSELQLALIALAAVLLLALYAGEKWQEQRRLRRLRERLHGGVGDALLHSRAAGEPAPAHAAAVPARAAHGRVDPRFSAAGAEFSAGAGLAGGAPRDAGAPPAAAHAEDGADGAETGPSVVTSEPLSMPAALLHPDWVEDPLLDCSLEIRCARAVDGVSVIDAASVLAHGPWKLPVHFVVWDGRHQQWVLPDRFGYYTDALASIQLADRRGRLDEAELARFVQAVQQVAGALDADVDAPDPERLLAQAQELDRLCARFDIRIGLTVESTGAAWTGPRLRSAAQQAELVAVGAQRWVAVDAAGDALYHLDADATPGRATLELDVAAAPIDAHAFGAMVGTARTLAAELDARVVDDNARPIDPQSVEAIERQLARVYEDMRAAGIEPGSARARRLYG